MRDTRGNSGRLEFAAAVLLAGATATAQAQSTTTTTTPTTTATAKVGTAHVIEWDLTSLPDQLDGNPGAMVVDTRGEDDNRVWFVTRLQSGSPQHVYRFTPARSLKTADASWKGWELRPVDVGLTGGVARMRPSHDRRFLFVRMPGDLSTITSISSVQRIDTANAVRTVWSFPGDAPVLVSDIAVDDGNRVFTTGVSDAQLLGYIQLIDPTVPPTTDPTTGVATVNVKRWVDDNGAGQCVSVSGPSGICNAGIDFNPSKQNLVYFTEAAENGFIAELNTDPRSVKSFDADGRPLFPLRRWSLLKLSALTGDTISGPRNLKVDRSGKVWINTGSEHLVSLDPNTNRMTKHKVPDVENDLWGITPDSDVIGYTGSGTNKVAMLFPRFNAVTVPPDFDNLPQVPFPAVVVTEPAPTVTGTVPGDAKVVAAQTVTNPNEGTYVEAFVDKVLCTSNPAALPSLSPLGITANWSKAQGTFFYTVGLTGDAATPTVARRIGHARLPNKARLRLARDDDDADDGFNPVLCTGFHNTEPGDQDADGVGDQFDTPSSKENAAGYDPVAVGPTAASSYSATTTATSLALIAAAQADNPTATIAVDVSNALGTVVASSGPMVGAALVTVPTPGAGNFTVRVRNLGTAAVNVTPTVAVREPALP
jgi:hypothetical protein